MANPVRSLKPLWVVLFALVPIFSTYLFAISPSRGWWLPDDISSAGFGSECDGLFNFILWITSIAFWVTQTVLVLALLKFGEGGLSKKAHYLHGHHKLEIFWTIVPATILVVIAFVQLGAWKKIKFPDHFPQELQDQMARKSPFAEVVAGQFDWRITYPGADGKVGTRDDVHVVNDFHIPKGKKILIILRSRDVLHSFYLPNLRLKQDAVPGMAIPVWFEVRDDVKFADGEKTKTFDLMCAELCGWGHYKMKGALTVHRDEADFNEWLKNAKAAEEAAK
jgi:cytochrome c oxidase subunit 2